MPRSRWPVSACDAPCGLGSTKSLSAPRSWRERLRALRDVGPNVRHGPRRVAVGHAVRVLASVEVAGVPRHLTVVARVVVRRRLDLAAGEGLLERVRELGDGRGGLGAHGARAVGSDLDLRQPEILQAEGFIEKRLALAQVRGTDALVHGEREVPALAWPARWSFCMVRSLPPTGLLSRSSTMPAGLCPARMAITASSASFVPGGCGR